MLAFATSVFTGALFRKIALYATASSLLFGAGYFVGHEQEVIAQAKAQSSAVIHQVAKASAQVQTVYVKDQATVDKLAADNQKLQDQNDALKAQVSRYVADNRRCDLSRGAVGLLNDAASGTAAPPASSAIPAGSDPAASGPSGVSERDLVADGLEVRKRYNQVAAQCNALIGWVNDNVVKQDDSNTGK